MTKRILLAGLLGGLAMFVWEAVAHMMTPLGDLGIQPLQNEQAAIAFVQQNVPQPGFYFFPAPDWKPGMSSDQKKKAMDVAMDKSAKGPSGILIATPFGTPSLTPGQFAMQFGGDVLIMLLAAFVVSHAAAGFGRRVLLVTSMALFPVFATEIPYMNWYKFPGDYIAAQFLVHIVGFLVGGLVIVRMLRGTYPLKG